MHVIVIGGGIVGATTAYYLTKQNVNVTLFDEGTGQATKAAAGIISPWLSQRRNKDWYQLAQTGAHLYPSLVADLQQKTNFSAYHQTGSLIFKKQASTLQKTYQLGIERQKMASEIGELAILDAQQQKNIFPALNTEQEALFVSGSARVDGTQLLASLYQVISAQKGTIKNEKVNAIQPLANKKWQVTTATEHLVADYLVLSTGAWLPELLKPLGYEVAVRPQKGQLLSFKVPDLPEDLPVVTPTGEGDIIPSSDETLLIGATHENERGFDLTPDFSATKEMLANIQRLVSFDLAKPDSIRVGTRAYTPDFLPFFGELPSEPHLLVASGLGSSGLTTGPIIAKILSQLILKQTTDLPVENYSVTPYIKKETVD